MSRSANHFFTGAGSGPANYIEEVFSTYLYTGTSASQTITNNIDLSTKGGLVWIKSRDDTGRHILTDTARGATKYLVPSSTGAEATEAGFVSSFNSSGFVIGADSEINASTQKYVSWAFRKQPKFFDVVTYTGDGIIGRTVTHNLGVVPGCIIVKRTTGAAANWRMYHRSLGATYSLQMNTTAAATALGGIWDNTEPTSTVFSVGDNTNVNGSGDSYVAYLFAHDAGGFGLTGTDNVISCGSFTGNPATINLGWEPQFLLWRPSAGVANWSMIDSMRAFDSGGYRDLIPNDTTVEAGYATYVQANATGFTQTATSDDSVYIAIRRGPMKVPTSGTSVFGINARTGTGSVATVTGSAGVSDAVLIKNRGSAVASLFASRLTNTNYLVTSSTAAQVAAGTTILQANPWDVMDGVKVGTTSTITNASGNTFINYLFKRAPSFMDVVGYTGSGSAMTVTHNLGVVPELMVIKSRTTGGNREWVVYSKSIAIGEYLYFSSAAVGTNTYWNNTAPTASVFSIDGSTLVNNSSPEAYVAYLFATCAGVSKVGSYTGTATTKQIDCGFTGGARFVLIKRTDSTGDWYVWDSARGIVSGDDPYSLLNSTAAEVTNTDYIDTYSPGFELSSTAPAAINANGGTYIFLAIA